MANPRLPFLYPNLMRAIRSCEPTTYRTIRIPTNSGTSHHVPFHTSRRKAQESYHRRYGPAAEANLPPPPRPKGDREPPSDSKAPQSSPAANDADTSTAAESASTEKQQSQIQDTKDGILETSSRDKSKETAAAKESEQSESKPSEERDPRDEPTTSDEAEEAAAASTTPTESSSEERAADSNHPLGGNVLEDVLHMPSPSSFLTPSDGSGSSSSGDDGKPPHLSPAPYVHHFDTYSLVRDLSKSGFTEDQSVTIMKGVRRILQNNLDFARQSLTSKSDVENETYLFQAACSELQSSLQTARNSEMQRQRASRTHLQHESDILSQRLNQELAGMRDDIKGMFNDHKMTTREQQRSIDTSVQELNYKITVSLNSDGKSEIEGLRWILTRRAALAIATSAVMIILFLKYYSVLKTHDVVEKKKEAPAQEVSEKRRVVPAAEPKVQSSEVHIGEALG